MFPSFSQLSPTLPSPFLVFVLCVQVRAEMLREVGETHTFIYTLTLTLTRAHTLSRTHGHTYKTHKHSHIHNRMRSSREGGGYRQATGKVICLAFFASLSVLYLFPLSFMSLFMALQQSFTFNVFLVMTRFV